MRDAVETTTIDSEGRKPLGRNRLPLASSVRRVWSSGLLVAGALVVCVAALASAVMAQEPQKPTKPISDGQKAFEQMKSLVGSWRGSLMGIPITFTIRSISNGTAILHEGHTEGGPTPNHEVTVFYLDGDRLLATHYCDAGNQVHWTGTSSGDANTIDFSFLDVVGSTRGGLLKGMAFVLVDANHHVLEGTFVTPDGKVVPLRGEFQRDK